LGVLLHGYQYTQFCAHYNRWLATLDPVLRQAYRAGERVFLDYAGQTMPVVDPATGEIRQAQILRRRVGREVAVALGRGAGTVLL
jgi:transposase